MLAYDLIGFQTVEDRQNFEDYLRTELDLNVVDGTAASDWGLTQLATFPIGIDVEEFATRANKAINRPEVARLRDSLHRRQTGPGRRSPRLFEGPCQSRTRH